MIKNYLKTAWRSLAKNKKSSAINIVGLSLGMAVFILIALWVWDELSYDNYHHNYNKIGQAVQTQQWNGQTFSQVAQPFPLGEELKNNYGDNFKHLVMASWEGDNILSYQDKHLNQMGIYMDVDGPKMLSLDIVQGELDGLRDPSSIMLSQSAAKAFFGEKDPINQVMKINQTMDVKVTAVYADLPANTSFGQLKFIAPWDLYITSEPWIKRSETQWDNNSFQLFAQIADHTDFKTVNSKIANAKLNRVSEEQKKFKAQILLHPMKDWRLRNEWKDGKVVGGLIEYVKLFSIIGVFVLALACINFMNLSTARSEKRAKEVGIRKTMGSPKKVLVAQFLSESALTATISYFFALLLVLLLLPWFNDIAHKNIEIPWANPWFWFGGLAFTLLTGVLAGSYPAFYLSSFNPLTVLKGTFRIGHLAALPRKALVVFQFTISVALIIGTIIVFQQIQFTKDRPVGYEREGMIMVAMSTPEFYGKHDVLRSKLKEKGAIEELSESSSPLTSVWSNSGGFDWEGKDPDLNTDFATIYVSHDYGNTIQWQVKQGRDYSRDFGTDSLGLIINEAAVKFMGITDPVGKTVRWGRRDYHIIGVINDMVMSSPFEPVKQTVYILDENNVNWINMRLNPNKGANESLQQIKKVFQEVIPNAPFDYQFVDESYANKFAQEDAVGQLATCFALLAIIISSLGVFGLASYMAEQRGKEIGIRKVIGASVFQLWKLLSVEFVLLVVLAGLIASPLAYYFLHGWLQKYTYHTEIAWWVFAVVMLSALLITMIVVSFQTIRAAVANPVESLRDE